VKNTEHKTAVNSEPLSPRLSADRRAFYEGIYTQYRAVIHKFLLNHGISADHAGDMLHDVYVRLLRQNNPEKLNDSPKAFLLKIAVNLIRDRYRRTKTNMTLSAKSIDSESEYAPVQQLSSENQLHVSRQMLLLKKAISDLPTVSQQVFVLHRFENMTCKDIAEELSVPLRTVQRHLSDAIVFCQRRLNYDNGV